MSRGLDTVRRVWKAAEEGDYEAAAACIGPGYVWIDHGLGVVARSPKEIAAAFADFKPWSNVRYEIEEAFESIEGVVVVRAVKSGNLTGSWRSMEATGQHVSYQFCDIFKFDSDARIVYEEAYYDMASIRKQLGYE